MRIKLLLVVILASVTMAGIASADLIVAVGDFQPRFKPGTNGPTDASGATLLSGCHTITYSGTIADFRAGNADNARPFIGIDQGGVAVSDYMYIDNILMTVDGNTIWDVDFESSTVGDTSGNNTPLPGTEFETANTGSSIVVDALSPTHIADPLAAGCLTGNFALLSTGTNSFTAIRPDSNPLTFASVPDSTPYSISYNIYIPLEPVVVPEPSSAGIMIGLMGLAGLRRRR